MWLCIKCGNQYEGDVPKNRYCKRCLGVNVQFNPLILKTSDKVESRAMSLTAYKIPNLVPRDKLSELRSYTQLHEKNKNLKKIKGRVVAKEDYGRRYKCK